MILAGYFDYINESYTNVTDGRIIDGVNNLFLSYLGSWYWLLLFFPLIAILYMRTKSLAVVVFYTLLAISEGVMGGKIDTFAHPIIRIILYLGIALLLFFTFKKE